MSLNIRWLCWQSAVDGAPVGAQEIADPPAAEAPADGDVKLESRDKDGAAGRVFAPATVEDARQRTLAWAKGRGADEAALARVWKGFGRDWPRGRKGRRFSTRWWPRSAGRRGGGEYVARLSAETTGPMPEFDLSKQTAEPFFQANLKVFVARHLVGRRMVDEALALTADLDPSAWWTPPRCCFCGPCAASIAHEGRWTQNDRHAAQADTQGPCPVFRRGRVVEVRPGKRWRTTR